MNFTRLGVLILSLLLVACANHEPKPPKTQEFFSTLIKSDGTKQFSYALVMEMPDGARHDGPGGKHGGHRGGGHGGHSGGDHSHGDHTDGKRGGEEGPGDHLNYMFSEGLSAKLSDTGFCRQGYKQLDKTSRMGAIQINAECNDVANEGDRQRYPNPPPKKIKIETIE